MKSCAFLHADSTIYELYAKNWSIIFGLEGFRKDLRFYTKIFFYFDLIIQFCIKVAARKPAVVNLKKFAANDDDWEGAPSKPVNNQGNDSLSLSSSLL